MIYIISTHGRTGSHMLMTMMSGSNMTPGGICNAVAGEFPRNGKRLLKYKDQFNIVIHTHDPAFVETANIDPSEVVLVLSKRYNKFEAVMSMALEITIRNNPKIEPFLLPTQTFLQHKSYQEEYFDKINKTLPYYKVVDINYEDILKFGHRYIASTLDISNYEAIDIPKTGKSQYSYKDLITNWKELELLYYK